MVGQQMHFGRDFKGNMRSGAKITITIMFTKKFQDR
jgi:hypothetical protein